MSTLVLVPSPTTAPLPSETRLWRTRGCCMEPSPGLRLSWDALACSHLCKHKNTFGCWTWTASTHLHRDLHWCLAASSCQGIYQSWLHNHPQLLCQIAHPWNEKQTALRHPAHSQVGGAAASSPCQEAKGTQCLVEDGADLRQWQAMAILTPQGVSFQGSAKVETHFWRRNKLEKE